MNTISCSSQLFKARAIHDNYAAALKEFEQTFLESPPIETQKILEQALSDPEYLNQIGMSTEGGGW